MAQAVKTPDGNVVERNGHEVFSFVNESALKGVDLDKRTMTIIGSDETRDRDGDVIKQNGWELDNYLKNPVFLWSHTYSGPGSVPLGKAVKVIRRKSPARLEFTIQFPSKGVNPFADMILELYNEGIINASSVGFIPKEYEDVDKTGQTWGKLITKQELLELSGCAVPCNPAALTNAIKSFVPKGSPAQDAAVARIFDMVSGKSLIPDKEIGIDREEEAAEMKSLKCEFIDETVKTAEEVEVPVVPIIAAREKTEQGIDTTGETPYNNGEKSSPDVEGTKTEGTTMEPTEKLPELTGLIPENLEVGGLYRYVQNEETGELALVKVSEEDLGTAGKGEIPTGLVLNSEYKAKLETALATISEVVAAISPPAETEKVSTEPVAETPEVTELYTEDTIAQITAQIAAVTQSIKEVL